MTKLLAHGKALLKGNCALRIKKVVSRKTRLTLGMSSLSLFDSQYHELFNIIVLRVFIEPLVTKKSVAKKLGLTPNAVPEAQLDSSKLSTSSMSEDDSFDDEVSPGDDADISELEAAS